MLRFIRISLYGITATCAVLFCFVHGHKQLEVITLLTGALSAFVAFTLSFSHTPNKKNGKKKSQQPTAPCNRIMWNRPSTFCEGIQTADITTKTCRKKLAEKAFSAAE
jgi:hypothetical protein